MGWWPFSSSDSSSSPRAESIRTGAAIPTRAERTACWAARDAYFACLDAQDIIDTTKEPGARDARRACGREEQAFERDCAAAWVTYFRQWRVADVQKRRRMEELRAQGAQEMQVGTSFAPAGDGAVTAVGASAKGAKGKEDIQEMLDRKRAR